MPQISEFSWFYFIFYSIFIYTLFFFLFFYSNFSMSVKFNSCFSGKKFLFFS